MEDIKKTWPEEELTRLNGRLDAMGKAFMELKKPEERKYTVRPHSSFETAEIDTAHSLAFAELKNVPRYAQANRNTYAKIEHCTEYLNPILAKFDLSTKQLLSFNEYGEDIIITRLSHKSGQWYESVTQLKLDKNGSQSINQQYGSAVTYMRRYALLAILGIGQIDDPTDTDR